MGLVEQWRRELSAKPVIANPHASPEDQRIRPRSAATLNRYDRTTGSTEPRSLRGYVSTDVAWLAALRPVGGADKARDVCTEQRKGTNCWNNIKPTYAPCEALLIPRPGAMADLTVANFNKQQRVLTIGRTRRDVIAKSSSQSHLDLFKRNCENKATLARTYSPARTARPGIKDAHGKNRSRQRLHVPA